MNGGRPTLSGARRRIALVIGVAMIALALVILWRLIGLARAPVTGSRWIDIAFAALFLLRGAMNVRMAKRPPPSGSGAQS
ncbi:MAG TPA: hypothetical protein VMM18_15520 [Gemmatimonadaceae bacterium]|nr:hypothetical protein [Gemmatimonadaceae bacterium]